MKRQFLGDQRLGCQHRPSSGIKCLTIGRQLTQELFASFLVCAGLLPTSGAEVTECTEAALRSGMTQGGVVTFACDGTILLANTITNLNDVWLAANGHQVTMSGGGLVPLFRVTSNVTFSAVNLTLANGLGASGGGIYNDGGTVNLTNCIFLNNNASAPDQPYLGGTNGTDGCGGAIFNAGSLNVSLCSFLQNYASGGAAAPVFPPAQSGFSGGQGRGGAIYNLARLAIERSQFLSNTVAGGMGGLGRPGAPTNPTFTFADPGGPGGLGGDGDGGAVCNSGTMALGQCLFAWNKAAGGSGGAGGSGYGARGVGPTLVSSGGAGGGGGEAQGAALFNNGTGSVVNCTFAGSQSLASPGGSGGGGGWATDHGYTVHASDGQAGSSGGGFGVIHSPNGILVFTNCTLAYNSGIECGGLSGSTVTLINTLLAANSPSNAGTPITDAGHNLSSDSSCNFSSGGSLNTTDPRIGPLTNNGGSTLTIALSANSPAIGMADSAAAPPTDQRGFPRASGSADIGAYEFGYPPTVQAELAAEGGINLTIGGRGGRAFWLLVSPDLVDWSLLTTNQFSPQGIALFRDAPGAAHQSERFYRVLMP